MKDFPIRNIFLPATLVGTAIFSAMAFTLPTFVNHYSQKEGIAGTSTWGARSPLELTGVHKEVMITYIGTAIVVSASAGLGAAELLRKRSAQKSQAPSLKSALAELIDQHSQQGNTDLEEEFSSLVAQHLEANDLQGLMPAAANRVATPPTDVTFPVEIPEAVWQAPAQAPPSSPDSAVETDDTVMIFPGQYQRCRIQVPNLSEQQYAIAFDQQFYSLLNSGITKEQALAAVKQLAAAERAAILTPMNQGYAVWVLEPEAELVSVA